MFELHIRAAHRTRSTYGSQTTGRAGVTSRLTQALGMKLLYGSAFKAPSLYLLYATPLGPGDARGNVPREVMLELRHTY